MPQPNQDFTRFLCFPQIELCIVKHDVIIQSKKDTLLYFMHGKLYIIIITLYKQVINWYFEIICILTAFKNLFLIIDLKKKSGAGHCSILVPSQHSRDNEIMSLWLT